MHHTVIQWPQVKIRETLTAKFFFSTDIVAIIVVSELPPKESLKTDVIIELRYGMWVLDLSPSAVITCHAFSD